MQPIPRFGLSRLFGAVLASMVLFVGGCKIEKVETTESTTSSSTMENTAAGESGSSGYESTDNQPAGHQPTPGEIAVAKDSETIRVAYVTNGIASFWNVAEAGCRAAEKDLGVECLVQMPDGAADQKRKLEELITSGVNGVAVSPIVPANQTGILNEVAAATNLITHDSDAPDSNRLAYIGMNNYDAGRMCGKLVKEAMPEGGEVIIFVGRLGQLNADQRRQGVIDELLDRSVDREREFDPADQVLKGDKYTVLETRTDNFDFALAKSRAEDAIVKYPNVGCMVGLFAYNPPAIFEAIAAAEEADSIKVVGFDEDDQTLQAIIDGDCYGTIVQNPYQYGYKSVEMLAKLALGDASVIPESRFIEIPARAIKKDNVEAFWADLKELLGDASSDAVAK